MTEETPEDARTIRWTSYYDAVAGRGPRETALAALNGWEAEFPGGTECFAIDLGCGEGRDSVEFLRRGWRVLAADSEPEALSRLLARPDLPETGRLETKRARIEDMEWERADIVNASFVLPFCPPDRFADLWARIVASLGPGGRFAGQLFGPRDSWAKLGLTITSRADALRLLEPFDIEMFQETDRAGEDAKGIAKHWHMFDICARRRGVGPPTPSSG